MTFNHLICLASFGYVYQPLSCNKKNQFQLAHVKDAKCMQLINPKLTQSMLPWKSKKQSIVSSLPCEIQWLQYLLADLYIHFKSPSSVYCDNASTIYLAHNPTFHEHTKHIEIDCHVIREKIQKGTIHLLPVPSSSQLADAFTKPLHVTSFQSFIFKLGLCNLHSHT